MSEIKFGLNEQKVAAEALPPQQPAPETSQALARPNGVLGDYVPTLDQVQLPRINLVQNVGNLKDNFISGSVVFGQQLALFIPPDIDAATGNVRRKATPPLNLTVLGMYPLRYSEKLPGGARGLLCSSEEEVRKAGGTLDYKEWRLKAADGMKRFEYYADALVAIQRPEAVADDDTVFIYSINGRKYALAKLGMKGSAYTRLAKPVFYTQRSIGCLQKGYPTFSFSISTRQEATPDGASKYWIPVGIVAAKNTPEFLDFAKLVLGGDITPKNVAPEAAADASE